MKPVAYGQTDFNHVAQLGNSASEQYVNYSFFSYLSFLKEKSAKLRNAPIQMFCSILREKWMVFSEKKMFRYLLFAVNLNSDRIGILRNQSV